MLNTKEFLNVYGWTAFFDGQDLPEYQEGLISARVVGEERGLYRLQINTEQSIWASLRGKLQYEATSRVDLPAVGDWVLAEFLISSNRGVIHQVLLRKTLLQRKQIGSGSDVQILAANVDYVFITSSLNEDLNIRRLERYLVVALNSGCAPVILLSKVDLFLGDLPGVLTELGGLFPGLKIHVISSTNFEEACFFQEYLQIGKTAVVLGSSGVGKSTLVNYLIGDGRIRTQDIRQSDDKGKHTTTSRSLYISRFGGLIIDTPGMRELQLSDHSDGAHAHFADIEELFSQCRFGDCRHQSEPGCAVQEALGKSELSEERWQSYLKLIAEIRFETRKRDKAAMAEEKKLWKKRHAEGRNNWRAKRGDF